jgi:hypothetical protein
MLKIATAQTNITPTLERPVFLAGYESNKRALTITDKLWARAIALHSDNPNGENTSVVIITIDVIGINRNTCHALEGQFQAQYPQAHLLIVCSHTHFAPDTIGLWGATPIESGVDGQYYDELQTIILSLAHSVMAQVPQAVHLKSTAVTVNGVAKNYRQAHITDEEATALQFITPAGKIVATWVIYPCHPEGLNWIARTITGDYVHGLREAIEAHTGGMALFGAGALGGMMSPILRDQTYISVYNMGITIAHAVINALNKITPQTIDHLSVQRREPRFLLQNDIFVMGAQLGLVPDRRDEQAHLTTETNLLQIGDTWLLTVPGELFPRVGLDIKRILKEHGARVAGVVGLTNDELGYLLHPDDFVFPQDYMNPGKQYEESMSPGPQAVPALLQALDEMLENL